MSTGFLVTYAALWAIVGVQLLAIFALYHHFGQMYLGSPEGRRDQGPKVESRLKPLDVRDLAGDPIVLPRLGREAVLLFTSTDCPLCNRLRGELPPFTERHPNTELAVVCSGERSAIVEWTSELRGSVTLIPDPAHRIAAHYDVRNLPFAVGVDRAGIVRIAGVVNTPRGLEEVVDVIRMTTERRRSDIESGAASGVV